MESSCLLVWLAREMVGCAFRFESQGRAEKLCVQGTLCVYVMSANLQHACFKNLGIPDLLGKLNDEGQVTFFIWYKKLLSIERLSNILLIA